MVNVALALLVGTLKTFLTQKFVTKVVILLAEYLAGHTKSKFDDQLVAAMKEAAGQK
ncbi:hypothetical protein R2R70_02450 [Cobetia sp. SIMBA_158]|uniref:hypothetical protein n=1 Tax=Cobetia sp. SIMBA_158 TaxID=3081617 RepID=UPI00397EE0D0